MERIGNPIDSMSINEMSAALEKRGYHFEIQNGDKAGESEMVSVNHYRVIVPFSDQPGKFIAFKKLDSPAGYEYVDGDFDRGRLLSRLLKAESSKS